MAIEVDEAFRSLTAYCDSIIYFFRKRAELEAQYLEGLDKLLSKQEEYDRKQDVLFRDTSLSVAWTNIKAIGYSEVQEKRQLLYALQHGVIEPLIAFRDSKERQRRRIKEETSNSASEHTEYKAHTLRLKRTYQRKSEDVRHLTVPSEPSSSTSASNAPANAAATPSTPRVGAAASSTTTSGQTSPTPGNQGHASAAVGSGTAGLSGGLGTNSASEGVRQKSSSDKLLISGATIKSSRTQLNNLMNKLGSHGRSSASTGDSNLKPSTLQYRISKAKREAEESDANYRSALHHLETLRLQRERVAKASLNSLLEFCFDFSTICKSVFVQYCDASFARVRQAEKVCEKAKNSTIAVSPNDDVNKFNQAARVDIFYEDQLPYENYHVGVSYSLIFGVSLNEYTAANDGVLVPLTVQRAILEIDSRGLDVEGIYRVPGKLGLIQQVVQEIEQDEFSFEFVAEKHDVHTVAGVLKLYLRQLPESLLPIDLRERLAISSASDEEASRLISKRLRKMSAPHQATAKMLIAHFARVLAHSANNKMSIQAMTLCLNPVLFPEETDLGAVAQAHKDRCLEHLIARRQELFAGLPVLDDVNNPYRNPRMSVSSADLDDDDPPFRRSQESFPRPIQPAQGAPPSSQPNASGPGTTLPGPTTTGEGSAVPFIPDQRYAAPGGVPAGGAIMEKQWSAESAPLSISNRGASSDQIAATTATNVGLGSPPLPDLAGSSPKRTLSQRARSGSQSLANAVRNLAKSRGQQPAGSSPLSPTYIPPAPTSPLKEVQNFAWNAAGSETGPSPPQQPDTLPASTEPADATLPARGLASAAPQDPSVFVPPRKHGLDGGSLPAGAGPLLVRPPSIASSLGSRPTTPESRTALQGGLGQQQQASSRHHDIDPDSVYETYHNAGRSDR